MSIVVRPCAFCNTPFEARNGNHILCGNACAAARYKARQRADADRKRCRACRHALLLG